eukprot:CAMPEP_0172156390 /NCGR_PEP_ID=MMETSP1050-20130122/3175_1 /TAXON_ID=233186 /ORGANISM="Cryptomonas curvata, Strain CCAP979/52" /LENGTH=438 /DNA_ID=CAMNT_0012825435 /DNA_START=192 /DNA_END=1507 /DNA_ORIENTATION=-
MYVDVSFRCDKLASASMDYSARLWDVETGKMFREWNLESGARCVSLSCGDKQLAVLTDPWGDQSSMIHIFDTASDKLISKIAMPSASRTNRALWGPLNKSIITCNESGSLMSWDPSTKQCTIERNDHNLAIPDFTFHQKDQMTLITASTDMSATLYDTVTLEPLKSYKTDRPVNSAAISPLMDHVAVGGGQSADKVTTTAGRAGKFQSVFFHKIYETEVGSVRGHFGPINSIMFNPDGRSFTSGGEDGYAASTTSTRSTSATSEAFLLPAMRQSRRGQRLLAQRHPLALPNHNGKRGGGHSLRVSAASPAVAFAGPSSAGPSFVGAQGLMVLLCSCRWTEMQMRGGGAGGRQAGAGGPMESIARSSGGVGRRAAAGRGPRGAQQRSRSSATPPAVPRRRGVADARGEGTPQPSGIGATARRGVGACARSPEATARPLA